MTVIDRVAASRARQGLPPLVEDGAALRRLAGLITQKAAPAGVDAEAAREARRATRRPQATG
jgi:hypothetical protein